MFTEGCPPREVERGLLSPLLVVFPGHLGRPGVVPSCWQVACVRKRPEPYRHVRWRVATACAVTFQPPQWGQAHRTAACWSRGVFFVGLRVSSMVLDTMMVGTQNDA